MHFVLDFLTFPIIQGVVGDLIHDGVDFDIDDTPFCELASQFSHIPTCTSRTRQTVEQSTQPRCQTTSPYHPVHHDSAFGNSLKFLSRFGNHYETPLLIQSVLMNIAMFALVHLCVNINTREVIIKMEERVFTGM